MKARLPQGYGKVDRNALMQQYQKMQKQVALPRKAVTRGQRAESLSDRVKRRHAEAKKELERRKQHGL